LARPHQSTTEGVAVVASKSRVVICPLKGFHPNEALVIRLGGDLP
jgi:hypothetical protein